METPLFDIKKLKRRDESEWTRMYEVCAEAVFSFIYRRIGNRREAAKDLTQQAFLTAFRSIDDYDESFPNFLAWLIGIAKHYDSYFQHEKWEELSPHVGAETAGVGVGQERALNPREQLERVEEDELLEGILGTMPEKLEQALRLRYCEDLSHKEIGSRLKMSEKAAEVSVRRGRQHLQEAFFKIYPFLAPSAPETGASVG